MKLSACVLLFIAVALGANAATAQTPAISPFAEAAVITTARGPTTNATIRLHYQLTQTEGSGRPVQSDLTLDLAHDWALARAPDHTTLHDYRLDRDFIINEANHSFVSYDSIAILAFRVMERQNRSYLREVLQRAAPNARFADDCDAESELGIVIPGLGNSQPDFREAGGTVEFRCNNRSMGGFAPSVGAPPPATLWPTLMREVTVHPALLRRARDSGHAPNELTVTFANGTSTATTRAWRLLSTEIIDEPYPLTSALVNANGPEIDSVTGAGVGAVAAAAIAGRFQGGAPTLETWNGYVSSLANNEASLLVGMSYNMFPELEDGCQHGMQHAVCNLGRSLRASMDADPAVRAMYLIATAEQENQLDGVVDLMRNAQTSPLAHHTALMQSYALALMKFNDQQMAAARNAHLPTDLLPLMASTLRAFPYSPAYWTDLADYYTQRYEWPSAVLLYDVAFALPMPSAQHSNPILVGRRAFFARLRHDFPDYAPTQ